MTSIGGEGIWRRGALAGMIFSEAAIAISVELLQRRAGVGLAPLLVARSLMALAMLILIVQPWRGEWAPRSPKLALIRVATGGLTFLGWFGAIGALSAHLTQPILWLDALILAFFRAEKKGFERRTIPVLAAALALYVGLALREPGTVTNLPKGLIFLAIALASRAASYKVWERAQGADEHRFWLIAPALAGGALAGGGLGLATGGFVWPTSWALWAGVALASVFGLTGYFYMNVVMARVGAFYTRVAEHWQLLLLWAAWLAVRPGPVDWGQGAVALAVSGAAAFVFNERRRREGAQA